MVRRESRIAVATTRRSSLISVTSEASMATSVPVPIAMPTSAWVRAGASLIPSPTMATTRPSAWSFFTVSILSWGSTSASTRLMPSSRRDGLAPCAVVAGQHDDLKPESPCSLATASFECSFSVSATAMMPAALPSTATNMGVLPWDESRSASAANCPEVDLAVCHQPFIAQDNLPSVHQSPDRRGRAAPRTRRSARA